jgi:hypothetical protein
MELRHAGPGHLSALNTATNIWTSFHDLPGGRLLPCVVYDSTTTVLIVQGGYNGSALSDTWAFSFATNSWTLLSTSGRLRRRDGVTRASTIRSGSL